MLKRMKNAALLLAAGVVAVWAATALVGVVQGGQMDPPGPPGPTDRTPIFESQLPYTISQPGSYYLAEDATCTGCSGGQDGITITVDDVTLDLNGFTLRGVGGSLNGIVVPDAVNDYLYNIAIHNGTIRDWGGDGIRADGIVQNPGIIDGYFRDLRLANNLGAGLRIQGRNSVVIRVDASENGAAGIDPGGLSVVSESIAHDNGGNGFDVGGSIVTDSVATFNTGDGFYSFGTGGSVTNCTAGSNGRHGIYVLFGALVSGNTAYDNGALASGAGIYAEPAAASPAGNRIEGNNVRGNDTGIDVGSSRNVIVKNSAVGNVTDYAIAGGNAEGQEIDCTAGCVPINADPWANFRY